MLMSPAALGASSNIVRKALGSPDLKAMHPSTAAIANFRPCEIDCSDAPREAAIPPTRCASSIPTNDVNNESSIPYPLFVTLLASLTSALSKPDDGGGNYLDAY
jgi:hypothetical protein